MTGRRPNNKALANLLGASSLALLATVAGLFTASSCKRSAPATSAAEGSVDSLTSPKRLARALQARGGAEVTASVRLRVAPKKPDGLLGAQDITTTTNLVVDKDGHYSLREENDHDGGRWVFFTGNEIGVKLRYGKLIKRTVRGGSEPADILEQALGQPWAAWDLFAARASYAQNVAADGTTTLTLSLDPAASEQAERAPKEGLQSWRNTAVPTQLQGKLTFLPAAAKLPPTLISADITGSFSGTNTAGGVSHEIEGTVNIVFSAKSLGQAVAEPMPDEAEAAFTKQRTVLEERALLSDGPAAKAAATP